MHKPKVGDINQMIWAHIHKASQNRTVWLLGLLLVILVHMITSIVKMRTNPRMGVIKLFQHGP